MAQGKIKLQQGDALIVADIQYDFLPGGALGIPHGDEVIPPINAYLEHFKKKKLPIFASRDWHPAQHCSFNFRGGPWPPHCVQQSEGARFSDAMRLPPGTIIISKGTDIQREAYSAFQGTELGAHLSQKKVERLFVAGLATDYCILNTVKDAVEFGFRVYLLSDAVRPVDVQVGDGERAIADMLRLGVISTKLSDIEA